MFPLLIGISLIIFGILGVLPQLEGQSYGLQAVLDMQSMINGITNIAIGVAICFLSFPQNKKDV
ncbi:hypothetical protein KJ987_07640 [bacterium]|nr:hypothetical protein [bacterium]